MSQSMFNELVNDYAKLKNISKKQAAVIIIDAVRTFTERMN